MPAGDRQPNAVKNAEVAECYRGAAVENLLERMTGREASGHDVRVDKRIRCWVIGLVSRPANGGVQSSARPGVSIFVSLWLYENSLSPCSKDLLRYVFL